MSKPTKHGKKWQIRWIDENGKRRSEVYADLKDAEFALMMRKTEVEKYKRGLMLRPPLDRPFKQLTDKWLEVRTSQKRSPKDDRSIIKVHLMPAFGEMTLRQITSQRIAEFSADLMINKKPQTIRNILILLGSMLNQALDWGWIESVPKIRKPRIRACGADFKWLRTEDEVDRFLTAAKAHHWAVTYPMYATAIYTGMRAGELAGLRWDDINFKRRLITVQRSFNGPTKTDRVRHVPIVDRNLPTLEKWKLACGSKKIVFPNNAGNMWDPRGRVFQESLHKVLSVGGFPPKYITFHSLRHTFASHWVLNGGDLFRLQKILGHADTAMTQRYAHLSPTAFEEDWGRFGAASDTEEATILGDVLR
jgi:integrase